MDAIVEAALRALGEDPSASMQEIADGAGVHRATLYRHFPAREDLVAAIHRRALDDAAEAIRESRPDEGDALDALERVVRALSVTADRYRVVLRQSRPGHDADLRERAARLTGPVRALIERGQREGAIRADLPVRWIAGALFGLLLATFKEIDEGGLDPAEAPALVVATLLRGVRAG